MLKSKADETLKKIEEGIDDGQVACLPEMLRMIHTLSEKFRELAVQELADLIKNDTVVLERVVKAANTFGYNPSGIEITTVTEAIQVIGFDRVRSLSMSLILLENANMWQYSEERRRATMVSLTSGLIAEQMAMDARNVDPELAFLCGALRGYGRIVLATYMLKEFREAEALVKELTSDAAYREIFGITPLELAHHLMESSQMSAVLLKTLKSYNPQEHTEKLLSPEDKLTGLADYAYQVSLLALEESISEEEFRTCMEVLRSRYKKIVDLPPAALDSVIERANEYLMKLSASGARSSFSDESIRCLKSRATHRDPTLPARLKRGKRSAQNAEQAQSADDSSSRLLESGLERMKGLTQHSHDLSPKVISELLKIIRGGLQAEECWAFIRQGNDDEFGFSDGLGTHSLILNNRVRITPKERSVFGLCLSRRETVFIHNTMDPKMSSYLPSWYLRNIQLNSFILLCLKDADSMAGLIYAGWRESRQLNIHPDHASLIRQLLSMVAALK